MNILVVLAVAGRLKIFVNERMGTGMQRQVAHLELRVLLSPQHQCSDSVPLLPFPQQIHRPLSD